MAIFGDKKKKESKPAGAEKKSDASVAVTGASTRGLRYESILHPRVTEKATFVSEDVNAYVFDVDHRATKHEIAKDVKRLYKVSPVKIRVAKVPSKTISMRGKDARKPGGKKAYVYLKKGDTIEVV